MYIVYYYNIIIIIHCIQIPSGNRAVVIFSVGLYVHCTVYVYENLQARARGVEEMRARMFSGDKINITEVLWS